jgi:hypothetical protein
MAPRAHTSTNPITTAAEIMADGPEEVWRFTLRKHVADDTGHCEGCSSTLGSPVWPCVMHVIATKAAHLAAAATPRQGESTSTQQK